MFNLKSFIVFHYKRGIRFAIVGVIGTVWQLSIQYLLTEMFDVWYIFSAIVGIGIAVVSNYLLNYYWTFKDMTSMVSK